MILLKRVATAALLSLLPGPVPGGSAAVADSSIRFLEDRVRRDPLDFPAWNQLGERYLQRLRATGRMENLVRAADAAAKSIEALGDEQNPGGLALRARVELAQHRFHAARESGARLSEQWPGKSLPLQILGDALMELGDYAAAARTFDELLDLEGSSVATESRLAQLDRIHGRNARARERFSTAIELAKALPAPSPDLVAWCLVQRGELAFRRGDLDVAQADYQAALALLPDSYSALDHLAELRGAQGRVQEALALFEKLLARTERPEFLQAIGDLHASQGRTEEARPWHDRAAAAYLASVEQGHVHHFHHLAGFYADSQPEPAKAIEWARKDLELRQSIFAWDALAWALYKNGQLTDASEAIAKALATGVADAHLLYHAGMIYMSAGDLAGGRAALQQAIAINPRHNSFHVHR